MVLPAPLGLIMVVGLPFAVMLVLDSADTEKLAFVQAVRIGKGRVVIILLLISHLLQVALCGCDPSRR